MTTDSTTEQAAETPKSTEQDILYIGLDLGTSQSALATNSGLMVNTASVVGWPKDLISFKLHQKTILFGDECMRNRMSVNLFFPLEKGIISSPSHTGKKSEDSERKEAAPVEFIKYMISLAEPRENQQVYLVVGAPAEATAGDKQAIIKAAEGSVNSVLVASQPFLVAYGLGMYGFSLVVDIGAGTLDICRMHGTIPEESDQRTLFKAGTFIDDMLFDLLKMRYPNTQLTKMMARQFKEKYAYVGEMNEQISVELLLDKKLSRCDITREMKEACESILSDIISSLKELITGFDPEFQADLRENILLAGCVSHMKGLPQAIEHGLFELGPVKVDTVEDPVFAGAIGALKLCQDMPISEWRRM
ncbi:hypothetical protein AMJ80_06815 [bacterium SM23_31]|nr:MAG: hypothetical protein AMJ80_06815 [bacterium SM23_31]